MMQRSFKASSCTSGLMLALAFLGVSVSPAMMTQPIAQAQQSSLKAEADRLFDQGIRYYQVSQYTEALASWEAALKLYQKMGDRKSEVDTLNNLAIVYASLSQYEKAISSFNQILLIYQATQDRNGEARALNNLGNTHNAISQYSKAIRYFDQALLIYQTLGNRNGEATALLNLGNVYRSLSEYEKAIRLLNQALLIFRAIRDREGEATTLANLGNTYLARAQYSQAIDAFKQALAISQAIGSRQDEARVLNSLGGTYYSLGQYEAAIAAFNQALPIYRMIRDRNGEASVLGNLGSIYRSLAKSNQAIAAFNQALLIFQAIGNRNSEAMTFTNLGSSYAALAEYDTAIRYINQALPIYRSIQNRASEATALNNLGNIYRLLAQPDKAIDHFNQALLIYQAVGNREGEALALSNRGRSQFQTRQLPQAEQSLRSAIAGYETIRLDRLSEDQKISLFESQSISYRTLQEVLIARKQPETALTISEWGRTKALVERLSPQLQPMLSPLASQVPTLKSLVQIARSQNATLVEYSAIYDEGKEKELYIWVIQSNGTITFRQVDLTAALPKQCSSIAQLISNSRDSIGARSPDSDWLVVDARAQKNPCVQSDAETNFKTLHNLLIAPIAELLPTDPNQQVVFIPDGTLFLVPFAALKDAKGQFLIEKHTIRTSSSIQLLDKTHALKSRPKGHSALIVGNPFMPNDPTATQPKQLPNLPNAEQEVLAIAPFFNTKAITGRNGTKSTVLQQMTTAKVIHLATHGSFYDRNGFKSWLALAPSANDSGILTAEEVAQLKLSADLVVLSACDTGRGRVTGDGVVGLSRSFIAAGVPSCRLALVGSRCAHG